MSEILLDLYSLYIRVFTVFTNQTTVRQFNNFLHILLPKLQYRIKFKISKNYNNITKKKKYNNVNNETQSISISPPYKHIKPRYY